MVADVESVGEAGVPVIVAVGPVVEVVVVPPPLVVVLLLMVKDWALESVPSGLATVTLTVPAVAISAALIEAVSCVALT